MRRSPLGKFSLIFAVIAATLFALHFTNVMPVLNTVMPPMIALFGTLTGVLGYFERDKQRTPALIGMIVNAAFLGWWVVLLVMSLSK